jgi:DNA-binding protein HU-beta
MTKAELVAKIAADAGLTRANAENAVNSLVSVVTDALAAGDKITLVGFGTFEVAERAEREGRNPRTGETLKIAPSKVVKFRVGSKLKGAVA